MRVSPIASVGTSVGTVNGGPENQTPLGQKIRSLRMTTNVTPGYVNESPTDTPDPSLSIPNTNDPVQEVAEATQPLSPQFAALAKQRRALQQERQALDREKAALAQSSTQADAIPLARLKSDPLSTLLEAGVTYQQLTDAILANQGNSEVNELRAELKALKEGVDNKFTEKATQEEQQVLAEMRREALSLSAQGETYEMVRETGSVPAVMKLIERTYRETGEVLSVRDALQLFEDELVNESLKVARLGKVQSRLAPPPAPQPPQRQQGMRTLTNRDTASVPLSRKARALAAFNGTFKSKPAS